MYQVNELRTERAKLIAQAGEILKKAEDEQRDLLGEEQAKWDELHVEADKIKSRYERLEKQDTEERELTASPGRRTEPSRPSPTPGAVATPSEEDRTLAFGAWLGVGRLEPNEEAVAAAKRCGLNLAAPSINIRGFSPKAQRERSEEHPLSLLEHRIAKLLNLDRQEKRAQGVATGAAGLFTVPDEAMRPLEDALLAFGGMRQVGTVIRTASGASLPLPTSNDTSQEGIILAENTTVAEQDITFGQILLDAFKYSSKMIRVSVELLQDSSINVAAFVGGKLGERIGRITNRHFTVGTGTGQPRGIEAAAVQGKLGLTGQTTTVIYDDLVDLQHSVDPAYREGARWMFHDATLKVIKKLKDTQARPLWLPGLAFREPDTILGDPFVINQHVAVMAANAKSIFYGALYKYWIRDVSEVQLLRLNERFADLHQVAFLAFSRHDGDLLDAGTNPVKFYQNSAT